MHDEKRSVSSLQNLRQKLKTYAPMSLKGWLVYLLAMLIASLVCRPWSASCFSR